MKCPVLLAHGTEDEIVPVSEEHGKSMPTARTTRTPAIDAGQPQRVWRPGSLYRNGNRISDCAMRRAQKTAKGNKPMERVKGIEPSYAAWEAAVLPLNYTRL